MSGNILRNKTIRNAVEFICILIITSGLTYLLVNGIMDYRSREHLKSLQSSVQEARKKKDSYISPNTDKKNDLKASDNKAEQTHNGVVDSETMGSETVGSETEEGSGKAGKEGSDKASKEDSDEAGKENIDDTTVYLDEEIKAVYKSIADSNENFYGWLLIEGTGIDYPVMQGPDNSFYLSHNIERKYDKYGMLVMDENSSSDNESAHLIIYGHNVHNGDLFGELINYKDKGYYNYHPYIIFDSLTTDKCFEVFAVLRISVNEAEKQQHFFSTYNFDNKEQFDQMIKWAKDNSLYEIELVPKYKDTILSLVTCEYTNDDGRFVVLAAERIITDKNG